MEIGTRVSYQGPRTGARYTGRIVDRFPAGLGERWARVQLDGSSFTTPVRVSELRKEDQ